jgi:mono/diheme cytochrome c family protein
MKIHRGSVLLLGAVLGYFAVSTSATAAQTKFGAQSDYERLIYSIKGPDLYRSHCAACHGPDGKGGGPVAPSMKARPSDLTAL